MTVSGFAEKYGISLSVVRDASFSTETRCRTFSRQCDIPEKELYSAVEKNLERRIKRAQETLDKNVERLEKLRSTGKKSGIV